MLNHKQRSQVGLYIFILTATALALAGAGYLMGKDAPSWLETFIVAGMASLATAWRPGSVTDVAAVDAPAQPVEAQANPYLTAQQIPDVPPLPVADIPPMTGPTGPEHGYR